VRARSNLSKAGPPHLTEKHERLIEYMTFGCPNPVILQHVQRPAIVDPDTGDEIKPARTPLPGQQLTLEEAAKLVGMSRKAARMLLASPIGSKAMARALQDLRDGAKPLAMAKIVELISTTGEGKAADRKVQLEAARTILGDEAGPSPTTIINNTINNAGVILAPGYVMDLRPRDPDGNVIEGEVVERA
jgi:hypothetical protein